MMQILDEFSPKLTRTHNTTSKASNSYDKACINLVGGNPTLNLLSTLI